MPFKFSGHGSFACRYAWLPKSLHAIENDPKIFADDDKAMIELGIGKNMVKSARFWVEASGMAKSAPGGLIATTLGQLIFGANGLDPFMEDMQTLWLIHWNLATQNEDPLFAWDFLFSRWNEPELTEASALIAFTKEANSTSRKMSRVTLQQHLEVFLHTYVPTRGRKGDIAEDNLDCPLTELELLVQIGEKGNSGQVRREPVYAFRREEKPNISPALFAYCLNDFWQKMYPNEQTMSVNSVVNGIRSPGQVFKIPEENIFVRLQDLSAVTDGRLKYSDSASLSQIYRQNPIDGSRLLARAYH
jgi:hypothetical protein